VTSLLSDHISSLSTDITGNIGIIALVNQFKFTRQNGVHFPLLTACTNPDFPMVFVRCLVFEFVHKLQQDIVSGNDIESGVIMQSTSE
jgi:hypothetical protein